MSEGIKTVHFGDFCHKMENRVLITVILLVVTCGGCVGDNKETETSPQDSGSEPKDRRLLLNDPSTLLKEIEALHREMTSLKSHVTTMETEVASLNSLKTEVSTQRTLILSLESQLNSRNQPGRYIHISRNAKTRNEFKVLKCIFLFSEQSYQSLHIYREHILRYF